LFLKDRYDNVQGLATTLATIANGDTMYIFKRYSFAGSYLSYSLLILNVFLVSVG